MKRPVLHLFLLVLVGTLAPTLSSIHASSPAASVHSCSVFDHEQWRREHPLPAAKVAADLNVGNPRTIRMIYFLPGDRPFRQEVFDLIKVRIRQAQSFFADQMESHGFGKLKLRVETDARGEPLVHRVDGQHPNSHYLVNTHVVYDEIDLTFDLRRNVYLVVIDNSIDAIGTGGGRRVAGTGGRRGKSGGNALVSGSLNFEIVAHELGHAFGMLHDFHDGSYMMSYGPGRSRLSACHAEFLAVHPYFDQNSPVEFEPKDRLPTVRIISPRTFPEGSQSVTIQADVTDSDGLYQAFLFRRTSPPHAAAGWLEVNACRRMAGQRETTVEFEYDGTIPSALSSSLSNPVAHPIHLRVVDLAGNERTTSFVLAESSPHKVATLEVNGSGVSSVAFSPKAPVLATGSLDRTIRIWHTETSTPIASLTGHKSFINSVAFSPDGATLASGSADRTVRLWDLSTRSEIGRLLGHEKGVSSVAFSASDNRVLASGSDDGAVILWDFATRKPIFTLNGHDSGVNSVAFSRDGAILASGSRDATVVLWDVASGRQTATLEGHASGVSSVVFSPDGGSIASGSWDDRVILWDAETRNQVETLEGHNGAVNSVSFAAGGALLASGDRNGSVILWDVLAGEKITTFGYPGDVLSVSFSAGGALLGAGGRDGGVSLWDISDWSGPRPAALKIVSGNGQEGPAGEALARPLVVEVRDQHGELLPDAAVTFTVTAGEGRLSGRFTVQHTTTNADGRVELPLVLGIYPGPNIVVVSVGRRELATFTAQSVGTSVAQLDGDYRTWHLPTSATARLGKGALGQSDRSVALSADGRYLAVATNIGAWVYEAASSRAVTLLPTVGNVWSVAFSASGTLAAGTISGTVELVDAAVGNRVGSLMQGSGVTSVAFSPDGATLASSSLDGKVKVWNIETGELSARLEGHTDRVVAVSFSPDGALLASAGGRGDPTVRLWDLSSQREVAVLKGHGNGVRSVSFSAPEGAILASTSSRTVRLWDVATRAEVATLDSPVGLATAVAFLPDSAVLAVGSSDGTVRLWDIAERKLVSTIEWHSGEIQSVSFSPDGSTLVSGSTDGTVLLREMESGNTSAISGHGSFYTVAISPVAGLLASSEYVGNAVTLWNMDTRTRIATLDGWETRVTSLRFSLDGDLLATGHLDGTIGMWDVEARQLMGVLEGRERLVFAMDFSLDGRILATGSSTRRIGLWDVEHRTLIGYLDGHTDFVTALVFSPDGTGLASGAYSSDRTVRLWDVSARSETATLTGHTQGVNAAAFSPVDGRILATGSEDRTVRIWDVKTRVPIATLETRSPVRSVAFSPDGAMLVAGSYRTTAIWDMKTQEQIAALQGHMGSVHSVGFLRDGATLATGSSDGTMLLWDISEHLAPSVATPDFDGDGTVGFSDFVQFAAKFGLSRGNEGFDSRFDLDGNGVIGFSDFVILAGAFGNSTA
ncbi:MAG: hypothetical protein OXU79_00415 [Gemmatimonadota bacterium]|nr:hypothetical protein [Gemmatimonadota bacterium]